MVNVHAWSGVLEVVLVSVVSIDVLNHAVHVFVVFEGIHKLEIHAEAHEQVVSGIVSAQTLQPVVEVLEPAFGIIGLHGLVVLERRVSSGKIVVEAWGEDVNILEIMHENLVVVTPLAMGWLLDPLTLL